MRSQSKVWDAITAAKESKWQCPALVHEKQVSVRRRNYHDGRYDMVEIS